MGIGRHALEQLLAKLQAKVQVDLPTKVGAIVLVFDYGEDGDCAYSSTVSRPDAIKLMRQQLAAMEQGARPRIIL